MLVGRAGEIVSRRETPSQCGRVGSPVHVGNMFNFWKRSKVTSKRSVLARVNMLYPHC